MSFRCQLCGVAQVPATMPVMVTVAQRAKTYPERLNAYTFRQAGATEERDDRGGVGQEVVREVMACKACAFQHTLATRAKDAPQGILDPTVPFNGIAVARVR